MKSQTSRSFIVAGGMAAVVGIGVVAFALRSHPASVAQAPLSTTPATPAPATEVPDNDPLPVVAETPAVPSALGQIDNSSTQIAGAANSARHQSNAVTRVATAETADNSAARVKSADDSTPPTDSSMPADQTGAQLAASDSQITTDVKSQIAGDTLSKDANIEVITSHGVVALTGSLPSQDAIDHVKDVAGRVKDVKSVDASALLVASL
jgi:hyperosmotically inducible protein